MSCSGIAEYLAATARLRKAVGLPNKKKARRPRGRKRGGYGAMDSAAADPEWLHSADQLEIGVEYPMVYLGSAPITGSPPLAAITDALDDRPWPPGPGVPVTVDVAAHRVDVLERTTGDRVALWAIHTVGTVSAHNKDDLRASLVTRVDGKMKAHLFHAPSKREALEFGVTVLQAFCAAMQERVAPAATPVDPPADLPLVRVDHPSP